MTINVPQLPVGRYFIICQGISTVGRYLHGCADFDVDSLMSYFFISKNCFGTCLEQKPKIQKLYAKVKIVILYNFDGQNIFITF